MQNKKKGFTLIEMVISITIVAILAAVTAPLMKATADLFSYQTGRSVLEENGLYAESRMTREIRRLRNDTSVIAASRNDFEFVDLDNKTIRYYLSGNTIRRTENGVDKLFLDNVQADGLVFFYYNDDTAGTAETSETAATNPVAGYGVKTDIRYLKIWIKLQNGPQTYEIRDAVRLRNVQYRESTLFF